MAYAVASSASSGFGSSPQTISKPTGLAEGDLMVALIGAVSGVPSTPSGWTKATGQSNSPIETAIYYKIATSGDAAASNFTFTSSAGVLGGALLRVTGNPDTSGEAFDVAGSAKRDALIASQPSFSISLSPDRDGSLIVAIGMTDSNGAPSSPYISGYTIDAGDPTWTEYFDAFTSEQTSICGVAAGVQSTATAFTSFQYTLDDGGGGGASEHAASVAVFTPQIDATGTFTPVSKSAAFPAPTGGADTLATHSHLSVTPTKNAPTGSATSPTQWTNETEASTTWTNEESL